MSPTTGHLALRLATIEVGLLVSLAGSVNLHDEPGRQCIDDRDTHAVQAAGDLVALATELAAGMQHGEYHLSCTLALVFARRIGIDGNAAPVVVDTTATIGEQGDGDLVAMPGHGFVDGVVDDFPDQVMETLEAG